MKKFCVLICLFVGIPSGYAIQLLLPQTEGMPGQVLGLSDNEGTLSWLSMESLTTLTGCLTFEDNDLEAAGKICANTNAFIIAPQGVRALQTTVSGNNRGVNAIDLQITTSEVTMVASGDFSVITGGFANTAQGDYDIITGGQGNRSTIDDNPSDGNICGYNGLCGSDNMITINTASATTAGITAGFNTIAGGNQNSIAVSLPAQSFVPNTLAGYYTVSLMPYVNLNGLAITPNGQYAYIVDNGNSSLSIVDLTTNTALPETINTGLQPYAIALTPDGYYAYVTNNGGSNVSVIDISNNTPINSINVGNNPEGIAIAPDGQYAFVANAGSDNISVIDVATQSVTATINVGNYPTGVAITPDGQYAYVANTNSNSISVIDVATHIITFTITGGFTNPTTLAITPNGTYVYVTNTGSDYVSVIENNIPVGSVSVGSGPEGIAITPNGNYVYVLFGNNSVSVIDSATNQVIDSLNVQGDSALGIAIAPNGQYAYVTSSIPGLVGIINNVYIGPLLPQGFNVIGGGLQNQITVSPQPVSIPIGQHVIGGGFSNTITCTSNGTGVGSFIGGGSSNTILCSPGVIVGGYLNTIASGNSAFIGGGQNNRASGNFSAITGGYTNTASGDYSVASGSLCTAQGDYSMAVGTLATTTCAHSFIWGDGSTLFTATASNTFNVLASNGARFITSLSTYQGVQLLPGSGAWISVSDKNKKMNFEQVDTRAVLEKVAALPIEIWSYKSQDASVRHMGPYAQDFHALFGLGEDPLGIATVDADGVAFAAIQGLYALQKEQARTIALLQQHIVELHDKINLFLK